MKSTVHCLLSLTLLAGLAFGTRAAEPAACDRACLTRFIDAYLQALSRRQPQALALAPQVRFTEDSRELRLGEGLWQTARGNKPERLDVIDVRDGVAASLALVDEDRGDTSATVLLLLRLRIDPAPGPARIAAIETMVVRNREEGFVFNVAGTRTPNRRMLADVPAAARLSRAEAIRIAEFYPKGLTVGSFVEVDAPFAAGAYRLENGYLAAGPGECMPEHPERRQGCTDIKRQRIIKHPDLTYRVAAVDEERGIVLLRLDFGDTGHYGAGNALVAWEAFKVDGGQLHAVEAFMKVMPAKLGSGWD
ncbi:MAG: hypothetical protein IT494_02575 [Gammaproteobacteria bacterium]|nr:hypothetical protein [Gammaproteobacteria bacterium]